jgi:opacity protein-like surface antigen
MQKLLIAAGLAVALVAVVPADARAQVTFTPYGGVVFGGDTPSSSTLTTGASLTFMGDVAGFELDLGYTPDFFDEESEVALIADSNVTTFMGSLVVGIGEGPVRPYIQAGTGLVRSRTDLGDLFDAVSVNEWGVTVGGGVTGMLSERVGLRGDVRYIRSLEDPEVDDDRDVVLGKFDFWRATAGVVFRF